MNSDDAGVSAATHRRHAAALVIVLGLACLPALLGRGVVARAAGLYELGAASDTYWQLSHFLLLRVLAPVVVASSFVFYLAPGVLLTLALGRTRSLIELIALAFGASLGLSIVLYSFAKLLLGTPLAPNLAVGLWAGSTGAAAAVLAVRLRGGRSTLKIERRELRRALTMLGASLMAVALLVPKIFWENFNLDGIEAFEYGRSLTHHLWPHWSVLGDAFGFYHNFVLFAYPNHWFTALFGPVEAAARVPFVLYAVLLFPALVLLIEHGRKERLTPVEEGVIWLTLALFVMVQAFNSNYEPFFADLAENAATDTLAILCFLLACYSLWQKRWLWFVAFAVMTYTSSPGGLLLLGALTVCTLAARWPDWRSEAPALATALALCLAIGLAYELFYAPAVLTEVESQFSARNMLRRLFPPTLDQFVRFNALVFTSGILPALSLLFVRRRSDPRAWAVAGVTAIYFGVLYIQSWTSLHQFTPVMVLPVVVFWRLCLSLGLEKRRLVLPAAIAGIALSLFLSRPEHFRINLETRRFGEATLYRVGDYERDYEAMARAGWSLYTLIPEDYRLEYPDQPWGTDAYSWIYYATRPKSAPVEINYVVQPSAEPAPIGSTRVAQRDGISVYVRDIARWRADQNPELPRVVVSPLYEPMLRRTYAFYRAYSERIQRESIQEENY